MKKISIYGVCMIALLMFLYWINKTQPVQHVWKPTYSTRDKEPYGSYVFDRLLKDSWEEPYIHSYKSISRLKADGELTGKNLLILTEEFPAGNTDIDILLEYIKDGGTAFIAMSYDYTSLCDSLNFYVGQDYFPDISLHSLSTRNKDVIRFYTPGLAEKTCYVPSALNSRYLSFPRKDSIKNILSVVATSNNENIIMVRYRLGKGNLILSCNPLMFTNYGILDDSVKGFVRNALSFLQGKPLIRTEYYHAGSNAVEENHSIFRYLQSNRSLRWALNLTFIVIFLFMIFTAKRRQKAIAVIKPPQNKMLDFVRSIAGLYIRKNNNADIIIKKKIYWADYIKRNYGIDMMNEKHNLAFYERLAAKTNTSMEKIADLFVDLDKINKNTSVSDEDMMRLITIIHSIK
jgi:hypothetical protein